MGRGRWRRWVIRMLLLLPVLVLALLHGFSLAMDRMDRTPNGALAREQPVPDGFSIRIYTRLTAAAQGSAILIHGTPGSTFAWMEQFRQPPPDLDVYAYDRPGFGASGGSRPAPDLDFQVRTLHQALLRENLRRPLYLVGHSYGAPVALRAALDYPDRIDGVLSIGGAVDPAQEEQYLVQHAAALPLLRWLLPVKLRVSNEELLTLRADLHRMAAQLDTLRVPVLMLHGDQDANVPVANVTYLEEALRRVGKSRLFAKRVYAGVNHFIPWERPELVAGALADLRALLTAQ